jgi:hypothetical protein
MNERRYTDEEVEQIFRNAAEEERPARRDRTSRDGMTLAELQEIGGEVGIPSEQIARAAARLDGEGGMALVRPRSTLLGLPISASRAIDLPRAPTDREWAILVAELRDVFQAGGRDTSTPGSRIWRNGNLRVAIEPTESGYSLRMRTRKGDAPLTVGIGFLFLVLAIMMLVDGRDSGEIASSILFLLLGAGAFTYNAVQLPRWAAEREGQMEHIAKRAVDLLSRPPMEASPGGELSAEAPRTRGSLPGM